MKKIVLTLDLMDNKAKQKAMKTVSTLPGIDSITMEMNTKKLTVTGAVDPVSLVTKLRKYWPETTIVLVGPVKEPEKPAPEKKPEESGGGDKKETGGGGGDKKPEGDGKKEEAGGEKKDGDKKEGDNTKEGEKKEGDGKKESEKTVAKPVQPMVAPPVYFHMPPQMQYPDMMRGYRPNYYYNSAPHPAQMSMYHHQQQQHYYSPSVEENPNACTIC